jgi:6-pyruvoyltetrahydropterin/6-carboxytetrahydropterin synthase
MYLTISKRFEFSASHRLAVQGWSEEENRAFYGPESGGPYGHGHNYEAYFVFNGKVQKITGMMVNIATIKERIKDVLDARYDHKFLNTDTPPFDEVVPTVENLARELLDDAKIAFEGHIAQPVVCHLVESPWSEATAYANGKIERHWRTGFSAARRTYSPFLSDEENAKLFGIAASPSGHGHHYRMRITLPGNVDEEHGMIFREQDALRIIKDLRNRFDHKNLNTDLPELKGKPITTEMLANHFFNELKLYTRINRLSLAENDNFSVERIEDISGRHTVMSVSSHFFAAHRLHSPHLTNNENDSIYGICNNPNGHGHLYRVECTISDGLDRRSGTVYDLGKLNVSLARVLEGWNYKHLDRELPEFQTRPSTSENIVHSLWDQLQEQLEPELYRLRLWETKNNRFTLRSHKGTKSQRKDFK